MWTNEDVLVTLPIKPCLLTIASHTSEPLCKTPQRDQTILKVQSHCSSWWDTPKLGLLATRLFTHSVQFKQGGIYMIRQAHMCSIPSLRSFPRWCLWTSTSFGHRQQRLLLTLSNPSPVTNIKVAIHFCTKMLRKKHDLINLGTCQNDEQNHTCIWLAHQFGKIHATPKPDSLFHGLHVKYLCLFVVACDRQLS